MLAAHASPIQTSPNCCIIQWDLEQQPEPEQRPAQLTESQYQINGGVLDL